MKANLWCCYQCDVPTGCIKNLRILCTRKIGCICTCKKCATTTRKIFLFFFWGGPAQLGVRFQAGGPAHNLQATSCQENYFNFFLELWDLMGYNSWQEDI